MKFSEDEVIIAIKSDSWLSKFRDESDRLSLIENAVKAVIGNSPKIVLRAPQAGDDDLRKGASVATQKPKPKQPLIPPHADTEEVVKDVEEINDSDAGTDNISAAEKKNFKSI